jgi:hypothetical protein
MTGLYGLITVELGTDMKRLFIALVILLPLIALGAYRENPITTNTPAGMSNVIFRAAAGYGFVSNNQASVTFGTVTANTLNSTNSITGTNTAVQSKVEEVRAGSAYFTNYAGFPSNASSPTHLEGRVFYDAAQHTLGYYNDSSAVTVNVGQEQLVRVRNNTGAQIDDGTAVYISGATGQTPEITKAIATNLAASCVIGLTTMDIAHNGYGYVTTAGLVNGIKTSYFTDGQMLFLSTNILGALTNVQPTSPAYCIHVGTCVYSHVNNGKILVHPNRGSVDLGNIIGYGDVLTNNYSAPVAFQQHLSVSNMFLLYPQWIDIPMNYGFSVTGPTAPSLTAVSPTSPIQALAFDNGDILYAQAQWQHNVASTNALYPEFLIYPHVHFSTVGAGLPDATHSNVTWRIEWEWASINNFYTNAWSIGTNTATVGVTTNYFHYMATLGPITNTVPPGISAIFRCRLMRPASGVRDYSNNHDVILDSIDVHIPVGNTRVLGSRSDAAP